MDCSESVTVFSSWRNHSFSGCAAEAVPYGMAILQAQDTLLSSQFQISISSPSAWWLLNKGVLREGRVCAESEGGFQITNEVFRHCFSDLTLYDTRALCRCAVRCGVQACIAPAGTHIPLSSNYNEVEHSCLLFVFTAIYKVSQRI